MYRNHRRQPASVVLAQACPNNKKYPGAILLYTQTNLLFGNFQGHYVHPLAHQFVIFFIKTKFPKKTSPMTIMFVHLSVF